MEEPVLVPKKAKVILKSKGIDLQFCTSERLSFLCAWNMAVHYLHLSQIPNVLENRKLKSFRC